MTNPAIAAKFPRRQRRGSQASYGSDRAAAADAAKQPGDSTASRADPAAAALAGSNNHSNQTARNGTGRHQNGHGSHSTSAKNPFAATPKNIRQQQLLCNLVAAADSFTDPSAPAASGGASRAPSLDYSGMPPAFPGRPSTDHRQSMDMNNMSRATSRTSLESWGYMRGRNSMDVNSAGNRASMESSGYTTSMRSSMDRASCWSGRPSVDSTFSAYSPVAQQQQQVAAAAAAAAVAARASFEAALPPTPASGSINRMGMWQPGRASCDMGPLSPGMPQSAFVRYSLDSHVDTHVAAAAAAAAASAFQMEQTRSLNGLLRYDSTAMSSSGSMDSAGTPSCCPASPATPAELAAAAAAISARRVQVAQMQQLQEIIDSMSAAQNGNSGISAETAAALATLTAQGVSLDTAAILLMQAQQNAATAAAAAASSSNGNGGMAPEAVMFQQQLQQIMQANQMAAAAANSAAQAAAASKLYAASAAHTQASQQRQQNSQRWHRLGYDSGEAELYQEQSAPLASAFDAGNLQQQLELLQRMQL